METKNSCKVEDNQQWLFPICFYASCNISIPPRVFQIWCWAVGYSRCASLQEWFFSRGDPNIPRPDETCDPSRDVPAGMNLTASADGHVTNCHQPFFGLHDDGPLLLFTERCLCSRRLSHSSLLRLSPAAVTRQPGLCQSTNTLMPLFCFLSCENSHSHIEKLRLQFHEDPSVPFI